MKKACNHSFTCLTVGYRQVTFVSTSIEWSTPNGREPSTTCSRHIYIGDIYSKRTRAKSSEYVCLFYEVKNERNL